VENILSAFHEKMTEKIVESACFQGERE